jgi:MoaA/NifB/PqqE/SkfB family radical SAM enzyme
MLNKLAFCCLEISPVCISKCKMCSIWRNKINLSDMPVLTQWYGLIESISAISQNSAVVNFAGAEPLADERNLEVIKFCARKGLVTSMCTNGFLINGEMARKIAESGLKVIVISLDGGKNTHEFLRGVYGCYDKIMKAINFLDVYRDILEIGIQPVIFGCNLDEIVELTEWADNDKRIKFIHFQVVSQPFDESYDNGWFRKSEHSLLWPQDVKNVDNTIDKLIELKKKGRKISNSVRQLEVFKKYFRFPGEFIRKGMCNVDFFLNVNSLGQVYMCRWKEPIGNIKKDNFKDIWYSAKADQLRRQIKNCKMNCHVLINCCYEEEVY